MLRRFASSLGLVAATALAAAVPLNYAQRSVPIRAGVVLIDSAHMNGSSEPTNFAPYVWFNLDSNRAMKPAGWNIYNPLADSTMTPAGYARWSIIEAGLPGPTKPVPAVGTALTKRDGSYWEVRLTTMTDTQLANYDVLALAAHGNVSLNPMEREKLRRFVDQGGVLWVDMTGASEINANGTVFDGNLSGINGLPIPFGLNNTDVGYGVGANFSDSLLRIPNGITPANLLAMQSDTTLGMRDVSLADAGATGLASLLQSLVPDYSRLNQVVWDNRGPYLMVGRIGDGAIVLTSRGVATMLNLGVDSNGNLLTNVQARAEEPANTRGAWSAAKLLINAIYLTNGYSKSGQGSRGMNSTTIDAGAPLLKQFEAPGNFGLGGLNYFPPAVYKGLVVAVDTNRVYVYNANPGTDIDGDGNPDEGIQDYAGGAGYDMIWRSVSLSNGISAPAVADIGGKTWIFVEEADGTVAAFDALNYVNGQADRGPDYTISPPNGNSSVDSNPGHGPYAPTVHEGLVYVADTQNSSIGRVWVFDPIARAVVSSSGDWVVGSPTSPVIPPVAGSPLVGYIPIQDNSGGQDRVAYLPTQPNPSSGGPSSTAGITSVWIGARGEKPVKSDIVAGQLQLTTRASQKGLPIYLPAGDSSLGIKLTMLKPNGDAFTASEMNNAFGGTPSVTQVAPGILQVSVANAALVDPSVASPRLDYMIDWGAPGVSNAAVRGNIFFPDDTRKSRRIIHNLAMSASGMIYTVLSNQISGGGSHNGGSLFALREEGQGTFRLAYRYDLYPSHQIVLNQADPVQYAETLFDKDPLSTTLAPMLGGGFSDLVFEGGPTVRNGIVYVTARGTKDLAAFGGIPVDRFTILMAFKAEPEAVEIRTPRMDGGFSIVQPDMLRSPDLKAPTVFSTLQSGQFRYETQSDDRGVIRIDNLMATSRGPMQNALSTSEPIIIRRTGQPDYLVEPDRNGSRWSPLLNYMVIPGLQNQSPPIMTGDTVFVAGTSLLSTLIASQPLSGNGPAMIYGINATISPNDDYLKSDSDRPWLNQLYQIKLDLLGIKGNPDIRWPQTTGVTSFSDWVTRVMQTVMTGTSDVFGLAAGDGNLLAWTSNGMWGFHKADFIVCDEGRLARFDSSGNPIWTADATLNAGGTVDMSGAANVHPLVRATKAYPVGVSDLFVVDTGADRVIRIDVAGREQRSIGAFNLDPAFSPEGYQTNERTALRAPRDVLVYTSYETPASMPSEMTNKQALEYWIHYVIADTGNNRIVELVDRYAVDPTTRGIQGVVTYPDPNNASAPYLQALGVLFWHSPASFAGKSFAYNSVARTWVPDGAGGGRWVYAAGVGGTLPTRVGTGLDAPSTHVSDPQEDRSGNNGIVVFDGANSQVINEVTVPAIGANLLWDPTANGGSGAFASAATTATKKTLTNISSVTMRNMMTSTGETRLTIMFTDATGVYEIFNNGTDWQVDWMMPRIVYQVLRRNTATNAPLGDNPVDFRPTYARRLSSGDVLLVNGYLGFLRNGKEFNGEVLQVNGGIDFTAINLGFNSLSIQFELPPTQGARGIILPVFADRR